jgi:hypothetical protein
MPSFVVSAHEMFEGGRTAMTLVEPRPSACSVHHCSAISCVGSRRHGWRGGGCGGEGFPAPQKDRHTRMGWGSKCSWIPGPGAQG